MNFQHKIDLKQISPIYRTVLNAPAVRHRHPVAALLEPGLPEVEPPHAPLLRAAVGHPDQNAAAAEGSH